MDLKQYLLLTTLASCLSLAQSQQLLLDGLSKTAFKVQPMLGLQFKVQVNKVKLQGGSIYNSSALLLSLPLFLLCSRRYSAASPVLMVLNLSLVTWVFLTPRSEFALRVEGIYLYDRALALLEGALLMRYGLIGKWPQHT